MDFSRIPKQRNIELRHHKSATSIRIVFSYRSKRCRETFCRISHPADLESKADATSFERSIRKSLKAAEHLLGTIQREIAMQIFNYSSHFPNSRMCRFFGHMIDVDITLSHYLNKFLETHKSKVRQVSYKNYHSTVTNLLIPAFGDIPVRQLTAGHLRDWIFNRSKKCKRKTLVNNLTPLRTALEDAVMDGMIDVNPMSCIKLNKVIAKQSKKSDFKPDPFTEDEILVLLNEMEGQIKNLFQFAFYTGLRTGELLGLTWDKVDFHSGHILVDTTLVEGVTDELKTADKGVSSRVVLLLDPAYEALTYQKEHSFLAGGHVFLNPLTGRPWESATQLWKLGWKRQIKKSGLRYRNPYQTRHTYAHMLIRDNENIWWIANQMGHSGVEMLNKHYGGWLEEETKRYTPTFRYNIQKRKNRSDSPN